MELFPPAHRRFESATRAKWLAGLFLLLALLLMSAELYHSYNQAEKAAQQRANTLTELTSERLTAALREASLILDNLDTNNAVVELLKTGQLDSAQLYHLRPTLEKTIRDVPYLINIRLLNTSCELLFSTQQNAQQYIQPNDPYCRWLHRKASPDDRHGERYFASVQDSNGSPSIVLASRLYDPDGNLVGLAIGTIAPELLIGETAGGAHGETLIMDNYRSLIVRWNKIPPVQIVPFSGPRESEKVFVQEPDYLLFFGPSAIDGIKRIYCVRSAGDYPIQVGIGIAPSDYRAPWHERTVIYLLAWSWLAIVTLAALRGHLANLTKHASLLADSRKIKESIEQARMTLDAAPIALLMVDNETRSVLYANTHAINMLNLPNNVNDHFIIDRSLPSVPLQVSPLTEWLGAGENVQAKEVEIKCADGSRVWVVVTIQATCFHNYPATLIGLYDISRRKTLEQEIERKNQLLNELAITDPLTHLYNRRFADETLRDEIQRCERYGHPMAVACFDIDHFKRFNDLYGHQTGDQVLITVANEIKELTRSTDICARVGGEEFLVIFPCTRQKDAHKVIERIHRKLGSSPLLFVDEYVTFSGGLTSWRPGDTASTIQARADKLLYQAKTNGRNQLLADEVTD